jgi:hypothetical protein
MSALMSKQTFESLDDASLLWACIEPVILEVRGKDLSVKNEAYSRLNIGQRALFMFQIFYGHAQNGIVRLFEDLSYLFVSPDVWAELKSSMQYFQAGAMAQFIGDLEHLYHTDGFRGSANAPLIKRYDAIFQETLQNTVRLIGAYIRLHPDIYVHFS